MPLSIKTALRLNFLLLAALPILLVGIVMLGYLSRSMEKEISQRNQQQAVACAGELERFLDSYINRQRHLAGLLEEGTFIAETRLNDFLQRQVENDIYLEMLWILDDQGCVIHLAPFDANILGVDLCRQEYYLAARNSKQPSWCNTIISPQTGASSVAVAVPYPNGMVVGHLSLAALRDMIATLDLGEEGYIAVAGSDGTLIAHSNPVLVNQRVGIANQKHIAEGLAGRDGTHRYRNEGQEHLGSTVYIPRTGWVVAVSQPLETVLAAAINLRRIFLGGLFLALLVAAIAVWFSLQRMLTPLQALAANTTRVAHGDFSFPPATKSYREISDLSDSFRNMITRIRERKAAQLESEEKFRAVIEQSPVSIQIHGLDGKLITNNPAYKELYAFSDEVLAEIYDKYNVFEDAQANNLGLMPSIKKVYDGQDVVFPPYEYNGPDTLKTLDFEHPVSRKCWIQTRGFPLKDECGKVSSVVFMSVDFTAQKQAEDDLNVMRAYSDHLIETANVMIVGLDINGIVTHLNPAGEVITGYSAAELVGKNWLELLVPQKRFPEVHKDLENLVPDHMPLLYENPIVTKNGDERMISWSNSDIRRNNEVIGFTSFGMDITDQKAAEQRLRDSEKEFRNLIEQSPISTQIFSPDGRVVKANQAAQELWGLSDADQAEMVERYNVLQDPEVERLGILPQLKKAFAGEEVVLPIIEYDAPQSLKKMNLEHIYSHKRWIQARLYPVKNGADEILNVVNMEEDMTEQRIAELQRQESELKFRSIFNESGYAMSLSSDDGLLHDVNHAWLNLFGYDITDGIIGSSVLDYVIAEERQAIQEWGAKIAERDPTASTISARGLRKDQSVFLLEIRTSVFELNGEVLTTAILVDITDRKQAEQALKDSEEEFRSLIEQSPISIQVLAPDGKITKVNKAFQELWGLSDKDLPDVLHVYNILEDAEAEKLGIMPLIKKAFSGEPVTLPIIEYDTPETMKTLHLEHVISNKRWIQARLYPVKNAAGDIINVVDMEEDMTDQKLAELQLNSYQERLRALASELTLTEEQERRRIATELHDGAAQSLALARVKLASANKAVKDTKAAEKLDDLSLILKESLQQIRGVLLDLSSPALNEIGLDAALSEWLEEQAGRRQGLQTVFTNECPDMHLDNDTLAMLFRNARELIMNAIKHADANRISVHINCKEQMLQIEIKDDGKGFHPQEERKRPGADGGFGLFSVYERMADMGGELTMESAPGHGCTATLKTNMPHCYKGEQLCR